MRLKDPKKLARLMTIEEVSQRDLASAAGWDGHSMVSRLLSGTLRTVTPERAVLIARRLNVDVGALFDTQVATIPSHAGQSQTVA